jgi:hypothetical protein
MKLAKYELEAEELLEVFEFLSVGPKSIFLN